MAVKTFLEILEDQRTESYNMLKDSILKNRMFDRAKLTGGTPPANVMNVDGANRHKVKQLKALIKELDVLIKREKESPTDATDPDLSLVLE